eukprot:4041490-Alexandrium_andersonii.AAC.1
MKTARLGFPAGVAVAVLATGRRAGLACAAVRLSRARPFAAAASARGCGGFSPALEMTSCVHRRSSVWRPIRGGLPCLATSVLHVVR